jgi:hypothetical protein
MRKRLLLLPISLLISLISLTAQTTASKDTKTETPAPKQPLFGINFSGYVKTDIYFDSRQTVGLRESQFLLLPEAEKLDAEGKDINAKGSYNFLSIQTRLACSVTGPDAIGAKPSAYIEGEFLGNINTAINSFRLRHAWVKLNWKTTELLVGQWWHPMFVPECSPTTVSFNTGAPFVVFSRNPQIKISQSLGKFKLALTLLSQLDFVSDGPDGTSPKYLRNSVMPESDLQFSFNTKNETKGTEFMIGAGINFQMLTPRISTNSIIKPAYDTVVNNLVVHHDAISATYKTDTKIRSLAFNLYTKLKLKRVTIKLGGEYGGDNNAYTMLGGYVVKSETDVTKNSVDYANIRSFAAWTEFHTNAQRWQPGLFLGFAKNLGTGEPDFGSSAVIGTKPVVVTGPYYARGSNIDFAYRISPRLVFNANKLRLAAEVEYTAAAYGKTNEKGIVYNAKEVANVRLLFGVYYFF